MRQVGFDSHTELALYMRNKGYEWDSKQGNYVKMLLDKKIQAEQQVRGPVRLDENSSVAECLKT